VKNTQLSTGDSSSPSLRRRASEQPDDAPDEKPEHSDNDDTDHIIPEHMLIAGGLPVKVELEEGDYNRVQNTDCDRVQITPQQHSVPVKQEGSVDHQAEAVEDGDSGQIGLPVKAEDMKESGWMCEQQGLAEQLLVKMEEEEGGKIWLG
jgi:hypothetical protein